MFYYNVHLFKLLKLIVAYVSSCDAKGTFTSGSLELLTTPDTVNIEKEYGLCKKYRNTDVWQTQCQPVCNKFKLGEIPSEFIPNLAFLEEVVIKIDNIINPKPQAPEQPATEG